MMAPHVYIYLYIYICMYIYIYIYVYIYEESRAKLNLTVFFLNELQRFENILHYFVASTLNNQFYVDLFWQIS